MDLTSRQRNELDIAVYKHLRDRDIFRSAAKHLIEGSDIVRQFSETEQYEKAETRSLLEKKWLTVLSLQKKISDMEDHGKRRPSVFKYSIADESHKLDAAVYFYLKHRPESEFQRASVYMSVADSSLAKEDASNIMDLRNVWILIPILQKRLYQLNSKNREKRGGSVPDEIAKGELMLAIMDRSAAYSHSKLLAIPEPACEPPKDDEHNSIAKEDGSPLNKESYSMEESNNFLISRSEMGYDLPIIQDKIPAAIAGHGEVSKTASPQDSVDLDDSFDEDQFNRAVSWATTVVQAADAEDNQGRSDVTSGRSILSRMSFFGGGMQGLGQASGHLRHSRNFRSSIVNVIQQITKEEIKTRDSEHKREEGAKLKGPELQLIMRYSDDEDSDEDPVSEKSHNGLSVDSILIHGGFQVAMECNDVTTEHADGSIPILSFHTYEEGQHKYSLSTDPFAIRKGYTLSWRKMSMTVNTSGRKVLDNCWGKVPKHQMTAILGPSGTGKSSILNILSGRLQSTREIDIQAEIFLDDYMVDPTNMAIRRSIAFVAQDDSLLATSTPREAIRFSAKMRLPRTITNEELDDLTARMLKELGLMHCADSFVGGPLIKGISGGERKRTSVGVELVTMPSIVCLDEPTSGLDAFSALQCCKVLRKVANAGACVMFTIHQPSSEIFETFNHFILMNGGRVMYQGTVQEIPTFFRARGHPVPRNYNPADWCLDVAQGVPMDELIDAGYFLDSDQIAHTARKSIWRVPEHNSLSLLGETLILFERELLNVKRDWTVLFTRIVIMGTLSFFIGLIFFDVGNADKLDAFTLQSQFGAMMVILITCMMSAVQLAMFVFPEQRPIFLREYSTNHYSVVSYLMAHLTIEAVLIAVKVFIVVTIIYFMVGFSGNYFAYVLLTFMLSMSITAQATCAVCLGGDNVKLATQLMPLIFQPQLLFAGFFLSPDLMPQWLSHIQLVCTMTYATRIIVVEEFYECSSDPRENEACQRMLDSTRSDPDEVWWYWLVLACTFVFFRLLAVFLLQQSAKQFY